MDPLPSLSRAYSLILQDESQHLLQSLPTSDGSAMMASSTIDATSGFSANAVVHSHSAAQCPKYKSKDCCTYYHILGHTRDVPSMGRAYSTHLQLLQWLLQHLL